ncbi:MAG: hypothetical protein JKY16_01590 [Lutibacter sp.]|nr:hypothetical protein [Lutibacter sp.]
MIVKFKTNINCGNCVNSVTPFLNEVDNIDLWKIDTNNPHKILEVQLDNQNKNTIIEAVIKAGFEIEEL